MLTNSTSKCKMLYVKSEVRFLTGMRVSTDSNVELITVNVSSLN